MTGYACSVDDAGSARTAGQRRYATSKLLAVATAAALAREHPDVHVTCVDPGLMPGTGLAREHAALLRALWSTVLKSLHVLPFASTPEASGRALAALLCTEPPPAPSGAYVDHRLRIARPSARAQDPACQDAVLRDPPAARHARPPGLTATCDVRSRPPSRCRERGTVTSPEPPPPAAVAEAFSGHRFADAYPHLADDVEWVLVGGPTLHGRQEVVAACEQTRAGLEQVTATFRRFLTVAGARAVAVDAVAEYVDGDGSATVVSSCDLYEFTDARVSRITSYTVELPQPA